jgi:beta-lactam-binding protein with PASTA domain
MEGKPVTNAIRLLKTSWSHLQCLHMRSVTSDALPTDTTVQSDVEKGAESQTDTTVAKIL